MAVELQIGIILQCREELLQLMILKSNLVNIGGHTHINSWKKIIAAIDTDLLPT